MVENEQHLGDNSTLLELFDANAYKLPPRRVAQIHAVLPRLYFQPEEAALFVQQVLKKLQYNREGYDTELQNQKPKALQSHQSAVATVAGACILGNIGLLAYWIGEAQQRGYDFPPLTVAHFLASSYEYEADYHRKSLQDIQESPGVYQQASEFLLLNNTRAALLRRAGESLLPSTIRRGLN